MIRIVGLSATLPNYVDVAQFLRVNPMVRPRLATCGSVVPSRALQLRRPWPCPQGSGIGPAFTAQVGLFFFDNGFRPVPLQQCFIGVKVKGALRSALVMNEICYAKVVERYGQTPALIVGFRVAPDRAHLRTSILFCHIRWCARGRRADYEPAIR